MTYRDPVLVTPAAGEVLTLAEARAHCRVDATEEDYLLVEWLRAAREHVETLTNRALMTSTWDYFLDAFPCGEIRLPKGRLQSVTSVKYTDVAGVEHTVSSSDYHVDTASEPGRIVLAYSKSWPTDTLRTMNPVVVRFVAGYGDRAAVPLQLKQAMLLLIGWWNETREAATVGNQASSVSAPVAFGVDALTANFKLWMY